MRIATYTVNGVNGRASGPASLAGRRSPDVVCLQELKAPDEGFPAQAIEAAGYEAIWHGQKSWNGVAILSRVGTPVETRRGLPGDTDDLHSRYVEAAVNGVPIAGLYLLARASLRSLLVGLIKAMRSIDQCCLHRRFSAARARIGF